MANENHGKQNEGKNKQTNPPSVADAANQTQADGKRNEMTSYQLLFKQWLDEIDAFQQQANDHEEAFLRVLANFAECAKRQGQNQSEYVEKVMKEMMEWEKMAREELLSLTAGIRYFFPFQSFAQTNEVYQTMYEKAQSLLKSPLQYSYATMAFGSEQWVKMVEQMIAVQRQNRSHFIQFVKTVGETVLTKQNQLIESYMKQVKNVFFPINRYIERSAQK